jgi:hypothetical protein
MTASGRNGFQVYLLVLTAMWALVSWVGGIEGEVIRAMFTSFGRHAWFALLIIGSLMALFGITLGTYVGMQLERSAMYLLAGLFGWVGMAFLGYVTRLDAYHQLYVTPLLLAAAGVALTRTHQITHDLDRMRIQMIALNTPAMVVK